MDDSEILRLFEQLSQAVLKAQKASNNIIQAIMEDYIVQISTLTGKSQADVLSRLEAKIGILKVDMFVVK